MRALAALLLAACASAPAPRPAGDAAFAARVVDVDPPGDGSPFAVAVVQFTNATERPIVVRKYTLTWADGQASSELERIVVPPGATVRRRLDTRAYDAASIAVGKVVVETPTATRASIVE